MTATPPPPAVQHLPLLSSSNYLDHLAVFTGLYESGALVASGRASDGRRLLLVVALDVATANTVADYVTKRIDTQRIHRLASATVDVVWQAKGERFVCCAVVDEGPAPIGKLLQRHKDVISYCLLSMLRRRSFRTSGARAGVIVCLSVTGEFNFVVNDGGKTLVFTEDLLDRGVSRARGSSRCDHRRRFRTVRRTGLTCNCHCPTMTNGLGTFYA